MDIEDYKASYMQAPFDTLTKEKLDRLEKHCKKAIHFERGHIQEEHQTVLDLLYKYQEQQAKLEKKDKVINEMAKQLAKLREERRGRLFYKPTYKCVRNKI